MAFWFLFLFSPPSGLVCCLALYSLKVNDLFSKSARFSQVLHKSYFFATKAKKQLDFLPELKHCLIAPTSGDGHARQ